MTASTNQTPRLIGKRRNKNRDEQKTKTKKKHKGRIDRLCTLFQMSVLADFLFVSARELGTRLEFYCFFLASVMIFRLLRHSVHGGIVRPRGCLMVRKSNFVLNEKSRSRYDNARSVVISGAVLELFRSFGRVHLRHSLLSRFVIAF